MSPRRWCKLNEPMWNEKRDGWIARAYVTAVEKMAPERHTVRAHTVTLRIPEVDKGSAIYQYFIACLIENKTLTIEIEKDLEE